MLSIVVRSYGEIREIPWGYTVRRYYGKTRWSCEEIPCGDMVVRYYGEIRRENTVRRYRGERTASIDAKPCNPIDSLRVGCNEPVGPPPLAPSRRCVMRPTSRRLPVVTVHRLPPPSPTHSNLVTSPTRRHRVSHPPLDAARRLLPPRPTYNGQQHTLLPGVGSFMSAVGEGGCY